MAEQPESDFEDVVEDEDEAVSQPNVVNDDRFLTQSDEIFSQRKEDVYDNAFPRDNGGNSASFSADFVPSPREYPSARDMKRPAEQRLSSENRKSKLRKVETALFPVHCVSHRDPLC